MINNIVGIVGGRNTGKTSTTSNLTDFCVNKGYNVAIIKFMRHKFDFDPNHKDSVTLRKTKATTVISTSPFETVLFQQTEERTDFQSLLDYIPPAVDIVICESYPSKFPKIPLIFACKNVNDFHETKKRYGYQDPLFITGIITDEGFSMLEGIPVLSNNDSGHLQLALDKILRSQPGL